MSEEIIASALCCLLHDPFLFGLLFDPEEGGSMQVGTRYSSAYCQLYAGFLVGLFFEPEDGGSMLLRNFG
jgi:hypothetical protein